MNKNVRGSVTHKEIESLDCNVVYISDKKQIISIGVRKARCIYHTLRSL